MSALEMIDAAQAEHDLTSVFALFSGGHDSLASTILASDHPLFSGVVHINTGIGIEQTRDFVRATCKEHGWQLTELHSEHHYEDLVLERGGFPYGTQSHRSMYWFLKQKPLRKWMKTQTGSVGLVTGIRTAESTRRALSSISVPVRKEGRKVWISPILDWTKAQCLDLIERKGFKHNEVVDLCHRSGECLCGALARADEIHDIDLWYPEVGRRIHALEQRCEELGIASSTWASGESRRLEIADGQGMLFSKASLPLCSSCEAGA